MKLPAKKVLENARFALAEAQLELVRYERTGSRGDLLEPLANALVCLEMSLDVLCFDKEFIEKFKNDKRYARAKGF